jgi:hypothetical protein
MEKKGEYREQEQIRSEKEREQKLQEREKVSINKIKESHKKWCIYCCLSCILCNLAQVRKTLNINLNYIFGRRPSFAPKK